MVCMYNISACLRMYASNQHRLSRGFLCHSPHVTRRVPCWNEVSFLTRQLTQGAQGIFPSLSPSAKLTCVHNNGWLCTQVLGHHACKASILIHWSNSLAAEVFISI